MIRTFILEAGAFGKAPKEKKVNLLEHSSLVMPPKKEIGLLVLH